MTRRAAHTPKRSLGQNFLVNPRVVERIIASCDLDPKDTVLEIGPGTGALTHALGEHAEKVIAVEKDDVLAAQLAVMFAGTNVEIVHEDILRYRFEVLASPTKIIGNLPYNIATPIIEKVLTHRSRFSTFLMTVQLEYGQRIVAAPGSKRYGSLSCFVQYHADAKLLFKISRAAFQPMPKVQSCFLRLDLLDKPRHQALDESCLFAVIRTCFGQRRKTVHNALSTIMSKEKAGELLERSGIDLKARAEQIALDHYVALANSVVREEKKKGSLMV